MQTTETADDRNAFRTAFASMQRTPNLSMSERRTTVALAQLSIGHPNAAPRKELTQLA